MMVRNVRRFIPGSIPFSVLGILTHLGMLGSLLLVGAWANPGRDRDARESGPFRLFHRLAAASPFSGAFQSPEKAAKDARLRASGQLARELGTATSIKIDVRMDLHRLSKDVPGANSHDAIEDHYLEMADMRFWDARNFLAGKPVNHRSHYWDGKRGAEVLFDRSDLDRQSQVVINPSFFMEENEGVWNAPEPVAYFRVGRSPLHEAILEGQYLGDDAVLGRESDVFVFPKGKWKNSLELVYTLDRETSLPLKIQGFADAEARERKDPVWIWTAKSLDEVQGRHFPLKSERVLLARSKPWVSTDITVRSIEFDQVPPQSSFWPVIQPGASVLDRTTGKVK